MSPALLYWCSLLAFALGVVTTLGICRYIRHRKFLRLLRAFESPGSHHKSPRPLPARPR